MLRTIETWIGIGCALFVSLIIILASVFAMVGDRGSRIPDSDFSLKVLPLILTLLSEGIFACVLSDHLKLRWRPFAPRFALSLGKWPLILRPLAGIWWTAHFAVGVLLAWMIEAAVAQGQGFHGAVLAQILAFLIIGFTIANAFYLYAMLALTAFGVGEKGIATAWRWRVVVDLTIAITAAVLNVQF